jgi:hypothetical protein
MFQQRTFKRRLVATTGVLLLLVLPASGVSQVEEPIEEEELQTQLELALQQELEKVGDEFMPRQYYIDKWNYKLNESGHIPYGFLEDIESTASSEIEFQGPSLNKK